MCECVLVGQKKRHCSSQWQEAALHVGEASKREGKINAERNAVAEKDDF